MEFQTLLETRRSVRSYLPGGKPDAEEKIVKRQFSWYDGIIKNSKERVSGGCRNGEAVMKKRISLWESRILRRYERMDIILRMRAWRIEYE